MQIYSVQKILDKRIDPSTNKQLYLIKWEGFDMSFATWEPYQNVKNCKSFLAQFESKYEKIITTSIGKIYVPDSIKKNHQVDMPKLSRTIKIQKLSKKTPSKINLVSQLNQLKDQKQLKRSTSKILEGAIKTMNRSSSKQLNNNQFCSQEKQVFSNLKTMTRTNSLNIIQRDSHTGQKKTSLRDKDILQYQKTKNYQSQDEVSFHGNQRSAKREVKRFTPIILSNAVSKISRKSSVKKEISEKREQEKQEIKKKKSNEKIQQKKQLIDIVGMREAEFGYQFYVRKLGKLIWVSHKQVFENYPKDLCRFYERNLVLK